MAEYTNASLESRHDFGEGRTEYGEVINRKVVGQLHNSPESNFTVLDVKGIHDDKETLKMLQDLVSREITAFDRDDIEEVGASTFANCTDLETVDLPEATAIGASAFDNCYSLTTVNIPKVETIGASAFDDCTSIEAIELPSVTAIGNNAFYGCTSLASVTIDQTTPPTLGTTVFTGVSQGFKIYVPADAVTTYKYAGGWSDFASVIEAIPA